MVVNDMPAFPILFLRGNLRSFVDVSILKRRELVNQHIFGLAPFKYFPLKAPPANGVHGNKIL